MHHSVRLLRSQQTEPLPLAAVWRPPVMPRRAGGLSGRPFCRIYPCHGVWVLELEPSSGAWLEADAAKAMSAPPFGGLEFPTLAAAIAYAEAHGLDYRVVIPPRRRMSRSNRPTPTALPKSWMARLAHNGRRGEIYHA
jgi:hypothetical protein